MTTKGNARGPAPRRLGRDGVALPMALLGLIIVTLLVTAVLLSSSADLAISGTHQTSVRGLYTADEGLEAVVAAFADSVAKNEADPTLGTQLPATSASVPLPSGATATVTVQSVQYVPPVWQPGPPAVNRSGWRIYCITAADASRPSRQVGAFLRLDMNPNNIDINVNGAGSFGRSVSVRGNASISGKQNVSSCDNGESVYGVETSRQGNFTTPGGSSSITGGTNKTNEDTTAFRNRILGGKTPREIGRLAQIKFGAFFNNAEFANNARPGSNNTRASKLNWGCPASMGVNCANYTNPDTSYYPTIAIDAQGSQVTLQGDHGQGILIIVNGGLQVTGNFQFKGVIVVDGALDVVGTMDVMGAVIGLNSVTVGSGSTNDSRVNDIGGTINITYDSCVIQRARNALNNANIIPTLSSPAYGWFEVVK